MKKIIATVVSVLLIFILLFLYVAYKHEKAVYDQARNLNAPIEIPDVGIMEYGDVTDIEKPLVTLFYADWCTYCRRFMPEYGKIAKKYSDKYTFTIVNCDKPEYEGIVRQFHITGFPSLFIVDKKLNHKFTLNIASTVDSGIFKEELDNYIKFRENILKQRD